METNEQISREEALFIEILKAYIQAGSAGMPLSRDLVRYACETYELAIVELNGIKINNSAEHLCPTLTP